MVLNILWSYRNKNITANHDHLLLYNAECSGCHKMWLGHEPVKRRKQHMHSSADPGGVYFLLSIGFQYGSYTAAAVTVQCRTSRSGSCSFTIKWMWAFKWYLRRVLFFALLVWCTERKLSRIHAFVFGEKCKAACNLGIQWECDTERFTQCLSGKRISNSNQQKENCEADLCTSIW